MSHSEQVRQQVSKDYARAVNTPSGCCSPGPKGAAAQFAGYTAEQLAGLPEDVVHNSFGCGNPLAFSEVRAGQVVLDLGSGAGIDLLIAAQKVGPSGRVIGIDMTDEMIARARSNIEHAGASQVEVRKGLIEDMPVEDESVDWVISNCVINLSPEKDRVFAEICRVLRPGGQMRVSDIVVESLPQWARDSDDLYSACVAGAISESAYLEGLRGAGLRNARVSERLIYEPRQVCSLIDSEAEFRVVLERLGISLEQASSDLTGKVWSARFWAEKAPRPA